MGRVSPRMVTSEVVPCKGRGGERTSSSAVQTRRPQFSRTRSSSSSVFDPGPLLLSPTWTRSPVRTSARTSAWRATSLA